MSMTADLRDRLIAARIAGGSVFRDERPQKHSGAAVVLFTVSDPRPSTYDGLDRTRETRVQFDCYGKDRGAAQALEEAVIAAATPRGAHGNTRFAGAFVAGSRDLTERPPGGALEYRQSLDLMIWHQPAA
ncbi:hypothetical protein [uncultured Sphingomonas sp.]|uniref:hypothetical protein n=1 Tax=uncultured Sphingomonas sp. TaxID=158754 RepID=UPI0025DB28CB|nr:hypothetical protein [uncultured Sphingomonas sp.]